MIIFIKKKLFFIVAGLILSVVFFTVTRIYSFGQISLPERVIEVSRFGGETKILSKEDFEPLNILEKISEGIELLENSSPLKTEQYVSDNICFKTKKNYRALRKEISFAILDKKTGEVFEKRCWFSKEDAIENTIISSGLSQVENIFGLKNEEQEINEELALAVNWWNNHNSDIEVRSLNPEDKPGGYIMIANKFPMLNQYLAYPQDKTGKKYSDIVYIPYSGALHIPELIEEGRRFLNQSVDRAFTELSAAKIESVAYPGRLVVDTIKPDFIKNIFLTEQTDTSLLLSAGDGGLKLAERVLVRLGANKEKAYRYTYSSTGALGLGQIMPATYASIVRLYSKAQLIKDVNIGRVDIVNGIKATVLVFDDHFATVIEKLSKTASGRAALSRKKPEEIEEMRAAVYNGGPGKISSQTAAISSAVAETVGFVAKFRRIRALNLFVD